MTNSCRPRNRRGNACALSFALLAPLARRATPMTLTKTNVAYLSIAEASAEIEAGRLSPVELTKAVLERIEQTDAQLNSYVLVMKESALAEAEAAEERARAGTRLGPLDGIPMGIKDLYDTAGAVTTNGTGAHRFRVPTADSHARGAAARGGRGHPRQDEHPRARDGRHDQQQALRADAQPVEPRTASPADPRAVRARRSRPARRSARWARTPAAASAGRRRTAASAASSRHTDSPRAPAWARSRTRSTTPGRWRARAFDCALMLNALQGYDPLDLDSVDHPTEDFTAGIDGGIAG